MTVNEELKETAIKEYLEENEKRLNKSINSGVKMAVLIMAAIYGLVFAALAFKYYFAGRYEDGLETFGIGMAVSLIFLLPSCLFVWIVLRKRTSKDRARMEEDLRRVSCTIEDGNLVRMIEGDGRRTKRYKLGQVSNVAKEGHVVTFDYGSMGVELLDFYEPSLYDILKKGSRL